MFMMMMMMMMRLTTHYNFTKISFWLFHGNGSVHFVIAQTYLIFNVDEKKSCVCEI